MSKLIDVCDLCKKETEIVFEDFGVMACQDCERAARKLTAKASERERFQDLTGQDQEVYDLGGRTYRGDECLTPDTLPEEEY